MLHPKQFEVNEAWIAFQMNGAAILTDQDGAFNCVALMDAASCFIFHMIMVSAEQAEPSQMEVRRLLKKGWEAKREYPKTLFVPIGRFPTVLPAEAARQGIAVVPVPASQLRIFIGDAQREFKRNFQGGSAHGEPT